MPRGKSIVRLATVLLLVSLEIVSPIGVGTYSRHGPSFILRDTAMTGLNGQSPASYSKIVVQPLTGPPTGAYFDHVVIIVMENEGIDQICHRNPPPCLSSGPSGATPYLSSLVNNYTIGSHYLSLLPTSQPNYVSLFSGSLNGCTVAACPANITAPNLVDRFEAAGLTWRAYFENQTLTRGCDINNSPEPYADIHNPFISFQDILNNTSRCNNIYRANPNSCGTTNDCVLINDLNSVSPPNFLWLTPNDCHNTRSSKVCTNGCTSEPTSACLTAGDNYLQSLVPNILNSNTFKTTNSALYITFDEGDGYCPLNNTPTDCIPAIWAGPTAKTSFISSNLYNHYSFTKTIEGNWGLTSLGAGDANAVPMTEFFKTASPDFVISSSPPSLTLKPNTQGTATITVTSLNGLNGPASLSVSSLPSGLSMSLNPTSIVLPGGGSASTTLTVSSPIPSDYVVTVMVTGGAITHEASMSVFVNPTATTIATDGAVEISSLGPGGSEKLIQDPAGRMIAVYADSFGRISITCANSDPLTGSWSTPAKSPTTASPYLRPSVVLLSLTSLRIIAEGGAGPGQITDIPVTIQRDAQNNILGFTYGTPTVLDSSGMAQYASAVSAHNGDILLAWAFQNSTRTLVKSLRWDPSTGWTNFAGSSTTPDIVLVDTTLQWFVPNIIERPDNHNLYLMANRFTGPPSTIAFEKATWNGSNWSWGIQNLTYETNASDADDDLISLAWDPVGFMVVAAYGVTGTITFGVFTLSSSDVKTHIDTPTLALADRGWGQIGVQISTGDYFVFFMNINSDGGSGPLDFIRRPAGGSWNATVSPFDPSTNNQGLSMRPTGASPTLDFLYAQGASSPVTIKFGRLSPFNPPDFSLSANPSSVSFQSGGSATSVITLKSLYNFAGTLTLTRAVSPSGATATLSQSSVVLTSGGTANDTLTVSSSTPGAYTVTIASTNGSITHIVAVPVSASDLPPMVSFTRSPATTATGSPITLTIAASDSDGSVASLKVSWGDGTTMSLAGTATTASHSYSTAGSYTMYVNATDNGGLTTKSSTTTVTITDRPPVASDAVSTTDPVVGETVVFNATSSSDPDGSVVGFAWSFGDSATGSGAIVTHVFTATGTDTVTLTVTDNSGNIGSTTSSVTVTIDPAPTWPNGSHVNASSIGARTVSLTWSVAVDSVQVTNYEIFGNSTLLVTVPASVTTYTLTGLTPLATYGFRIQAGNPSSNWSTNGPSISVFTVIPGDVNHDCIVDIVDLALVGASFGKTIGEPGYNPTADLNRDGLIDIVDLAMVGSHFGQTC